MPFGPEYVAIEQLEDQANSIRPTLKHVKAKKIRDELDAEGRIKNLEAVRVELAERQAQVEAELASLLEQPEIRQRLGELNDSGD